MIYLVSWDSFFSWLIAMQGLVYTINNTAATYIEV